MIPFHLFGYSKEGNNTTRIEQDLSSIAPLYGHFSSQTILSLHSQNPPSIYAIN